MSLPSPPSTDVHRYPDRQSHDMAFARAILEEAYLCHVGILDNGWPKVLPMNFALHNDRLILHGSPASFMMKNLKEGGPACITVTLLDGLVMARSAFHHSMNYRSVVLYGKGRFLSEREEKRDVAKAFVEKIAPGRWERLRPITDGELDGTSMVAFDLSTMSVKTRTGQPVDLASDLNHPVWAGVIPISMTKLDPLPDPMLPPEISYR